VGLGEACRIAGEGMEQEEDKVRALRERLYQGLAGRLSGIFLNGHPEERLAGNLNVSFASVRNDALMMEMKEISGSSGSTCTAAKAEPSYVLKAMGVEDALAQGSIRFGLGRFNTEEEVDYVAERTASAVKKLRELSPVYQM